MSDCYGEVTDLCLYVPVLMALHVRLAMSEISYFLCNKALA